MEVQDEPRTGDPGDTRLLAALCHDVRTPLNGLLGNLELLLDDGQLPAEARELVRAAYESATAVHTVFEDAVDRSLHR